MSRLSIEIEPEVHRQIKTLATFAGMSIKDYIVWKTLSGKTADDGNPERLRKSIAIPPTEHIGFESLADLKNALGI